MTDTEARTGTWSELLGPAHVLTSVVLAGGVALHATNIFLTTSLLPTAVEEIGGQRLYAWSTTVFMIASVVSSTLVSRVLTRRGPATAYVIAFAPFLAGTLVCALAPGMEILLIGRAIQGFGGGILAGLGYAVLQTALPEHLWGRATALISAMWGVGTLLGPAVGGLFAQAGSWRSAFLALGLAGLVIGVLAVRALPRSLQGGTAGAVPWPSLALLGGAATAISVAAVLDDKVLGMGVLAGGAALLVMFVAVERQARARVLPAATYSAARSPLKWIYLTIAALQVGTVSEAFTPLFGQRLGGLDPLFAGFLGAAVSLGWSLTMPFSASASGPRATRGLRTAGPLVLAAGLALTAALQRIDAGSLTVGLWFLGLMIAGSGIGMAFPHLTVAAMSVPANADEAGQAGAAVNTVEMIALATGSAVAGFLMNLGGPATVTSARYVLFGLAIIGVLGFVTAVRSLPREPVARGELEGRVR